MSEYELIIRNAYVYHRDAVVDVGIANGTIEAISSEISAAAETEINAEGNLVSPGLVDAHMHIDKALAVTGERKPKGHDDAFSFERIEERENAYYEDASVDEIRDNAIENLQMAVESGTTYVRSHVSVDPHIRETDNMAACLEACERTADLVNLQLVPGGQEELTPDGEAVLREAIEMGLSHDGPSDVLLGGSDPATRNTDIERSFQRWFELATEYDIDMDLHIHDGGTLGIYTLERLLAYIDDNGYEGRVTASHSYALANVPEWRVHELVKEFKRRQLKLVTCYQSTRPEMPMRLLLTEDVLLGHGTDNDRDFVFPHGNADSVEALLVESNKLHGDRTFVEEYRWFDTNEGLAALWDMITERGAEVLDVADQYGVAVGNPANLVVFDEPSPQWTIIAQANRPYVIKDGKVVVRDGSLRPEYRVVE